MAGGLEQGDWGLGRVSVLGSGGWGLERAGRLWPVGVGWLGSGGEAGAWAPGPRGTGRTFRRTFACLLACSFGRTEIQACIQTEGYHFEAFHKQLTWFYIIFVSINVHK